MYQVDRPRHFHRRLHAAFIKYSVKKLRVRRFGKGQIRCFCVVSHVFRKIGKPFLLDRLYYGIGIGDCGTEHKMPVLSSRQYALHSRFQIVIIVIEHERIKDRDIGSRCLGIFPDCGGLILYKAVNIGTVALIARAEALFTQCRGKLTLRP